MRGFAVVLGALALSGCVTGGVSDQPMPETCGAPQMQGLVGQSEKVLQTMRFAGTVRIIRPGMAITEEYSPARLNIDVDAQGRIARVWCG